VHIYIPLVPSTLPGLITIKFGKPSFSALLGNNLTSSLSSAAFSHQI